MKVSGLMEHYYFLMSAIITLKKVMKRIFIVMAISVLLVIC